MKRESLSRLNLANFVPVESTFATALYALKQKYSVAICSECKAKFYDPRILYRDLNDNFNITRFYSYIQKSLMLE